MANLKEILLVMVVIAVVVMGSTMITYLLSPNNLQATESTQTPSSTFTSLTSLSSTGEESATSTSESVRYWLMYHNNVARNGLDSNEPSVLSIAPSFVWKSPILDGAIYAEPLVDGSMVIAVTENNSVYALNSSNGQIMWHQNLGTPVLGSALPCGDINPSGITGTPVIDGATNTLYVVAYLMHEGHELYALNVNDGGVIFHRNVDPLGVSVSVEQERGALSISQDIIYIPYGGLDGDCGQYHGFVMGVPENNYSASISYEVPTGREGGIWATAGMAIDSSGNVYVATGNSQATSNFDFGDAVIKLSATLKEVDYFAPANWATLNSGDMDLGSVAPLLLDNQTIFQIGKEGVGYLLNASNLGKVGGEEYSAQVCPAYGGLAYSASVIYVPCGEGVVALKVNFTTHTFVKLWSSASFDAGPPIVSGNAVWSVDINGGTIYALNKNNGSIIFTYRIGNVAHFSTPSSGDGHIFVAADDSVEAIII